jgi:hypothetical protein
MSLLKLPDIAQKLMPFAVLLGAVFCFSRLSRSHELVATRAAGVSAWQFLMPPLAVAIALGVLTMTLFNPMASAFLSQYTRLEARYIHGQASQLAVSSTGLWMRQGDANHQSVVHALRVADQGVHLEEVIVFLYQGLDHLCRAHRCGLGRSASRTLASHQCLGQRTGRPAHASRCLRTSDRADAVANPGELRLALTRSHFGNCRASLPMPRAPGFSALAAPALLVFAVGAAVALSPRWCSWRRASRCGWRGSAACRN